MASLYKNLAKIPLLGIEPNEEKLLNETTDGYLTDSFSRGLVKDGHIVKVQAEIEVIEKPIKKGDK